MTCIIPAFSYTSTNIGSNGLSIEITVPEIYACTNIQIRFVLQDETVGDWIDYANLSTLVTTINLTIPPDVCSVDVRLFSCCGGGGGGGPLTPDLPDDPPCSTISTSESDCTSSKISITSPYRRPADIDVTEPYNDIFVPKQVKLTITNNDCDDIEALLCTIRCADVGTAAGMCPFPFGLYVDINTLPQVNIGRTPYGAPIDFDKLCNSSNYRGKPAFDDAKYTKIEAYIRAGWQATPFIDGVGYKMNSINSNTYVKVHTTSDAESMRNWTKDHFRFFTLNAIDTIQFAWPYNDLYWTPYDYALDNGLYQAEDGTVYLELVPC
jgi:hypothetical protein